MNQDSPDTQRTPKPNNCGRIKDDKSWKPVWTLLPKTTESWRQHLKCWWRTDHTAAGRKCRFQDAGLLCTGLCGEIVTLSKLPSYNRPGVT